jgi:hypothetical protein
VTRRKSKRVVEHWHLLDLMQCHIEVGLSPNAAAVKVAKEHWRGVSKTEGACVQWLKDNQRKFRDELDPERALQARTLQWLKSLPPHEQEHHEREMRHFEGMRENARRFNEEHPEELEKRRRTTEEAAWRIKLWHRWFRDDPKEALAQLIDELKKPYYDD